MFEIIPHGTKIPFMNYRIPMILFSAILTGVSAYLIITKGFNYGVDFAGGIEMVLSFPKEAQANAEKLRKSFEKMGVEGASVQSFGSEADKKDLEFIVHFTGDFTKEDLVAAKIEKAFQAANPQTEKAVSKFRFTGVEKAYLTMAKTVSIDEVKKVLQSISFGSLVKLTDVQPFGRTTSNEFQLSFQNVSTIVHAELQKDFGQEVKIEKVDFVGAKVGKDLKLAAILSLLITTILIFVYIFIRFDLVYAPGAVVSLIHDVTITAGCFSLLGLDFDLTIVAALLTLAGYSLNDTIIVYDRIREVAGSLKGKSFADIINLAANQTLSRTIITSGTVFIATLSLFIFGGPVIHGFAFAFLIGVVVGTYSSVFVAAPMILWSDQWMRGKQLKNKKAA